SLGHGALDRDAASLPRLSSRRVRVLAARRVARARHDPQVALAPRPGGALARPRPPAARQDGIRNPDRSFGPPPLCLRTAPSLAPAVEREPSLSRSRGPRARARGLSFRQARHRAPSVALAAPRAVAAHLHRRARVEAGEGRLSDP